MCINDSLNKKKMLIIKIRKNDPLKSHQFISNNYNKLRSSTNKEALFYVSGGLKNNKLNSSLSKNIENKQIKNAISSKNSSYNNFILNYNHFNSIKF
jgi:hypothetical protein